VSDKVRFSTFSQELKPSLQRLRIVELLTRIDKTKYPIYVIHEESLRLKLQQMVFEESLNL
jgi:hypothetical protein